MRLRDDETEFDLPPLPVSGRIGRFVKDSIFDLTSNLPRQEHAFFTINSDRFKIQWRKQVCARQRQTTTRRRADFFQLTQIFVEYARELYNDTIAKVFEIVLDVAEDSLETMNDDKSST